MPTFKVTLDHKPIETSKTIFVDANSEKHAYEIASRELRRDVLIKAAEMSIWAVSYGRQ